MMYEEDEKTVQRTVFPKIGGRGSWLQTWAAKLARRHGAKRAMVALARRIAVNLRRMWRDDIDFRFDTPVEHAG
jgi:transposase